jgi:aldose 1-epimerase
MKASATEPSTTTSSVHLRDGNCELLVCPNIGAAIARFTWRGHDILRPASDAAIRDGLIRHMGVYPMVPYAGRIGHGKLMVDDETFSLRPNFAPEPHAIHGFGWQRAWQVRQQSANTVELGLTHQPDTDWPFACEATQTLRLNADALVLTLAVKNTDKRTMPAGLGFHPFFPLRAETYLQCEWQAVWQMDSESLPTERVAVPPALDFRQPKLASNWKVDNCFAGWNQRAVLDYPTHRVCMEASDACGHIVVYAPNDGSDFMAVEPITHVNNAHALMARGVKDTGLRMLAAGESLQIEMTITMSDRDVRSK